MSDRERLAREIADHIRLSFPVWFTRRPTWLGRSIVAAAERAGFEFRKKEASDG